VLPFYKEVEKEVQHKGSRLINTYQQHTNIADITKWDLGELTPKTWTNWSNLPQGSYVLKGKTNSKKFSWNTCMFAKTREDIPIIARRLYDDTFISEQGIVVREYVPLKTLCIGINDLPIANEFRTFWYKDQMIAKGFYWASHAEYEKDSEWTDEAYKVALKAAKMLCDRLNFYVIDVAQKVDGSWIVMEINDGQMSGLSMINPEEFYRRLAEVLDKFYKVLSNKEV
jgi:hypothetical protein